MDDTQKLIKTLIESESDKQLGIDVIVEYLSDIDARVKDIERKCGVKLNSVYDTDNVTGTFVPAINGNPYYILIKESRECMLYVMTAFHEYRHLIDYVIFLKTIFDNNVELLKNSPLNVTFNVYSEYAATMFGVQKYIQIVKIDDMDQKDLAKLILQNAKSAYENFQCIKTPYQLLVHSMQYIGNIVACGQFIDDIDIQRLISEMEMSDELYPVITHAFMFENKYEWYTEMDKIMRDFVNGGVVQ